MAVECLTLDFGFSHHTIDEKTIEHREGSSSHRILACLHKYTKNLTNSSHSRLQATMNTDAYVRASKKAGFSHDGGRGGSSKGGGKRT
jgi:hypothetical protein